MLPHASPMPILQIIAPTAASGFSPPDLSIPARTTLHWAWPAAFYARIGVKLAVADGTADCGNSVHSKRG